MFVSEKKIFILVLVFLFFFVTGLIIYKNFNDIKIPKSAKLVYYLKNNDISF
jgi:uncharacterized membrane-anchored protein